MQRTFSTQGIFNVSSFSKKTLFALAVSFGLFVYNVIKNSNLRVTKDDKESEFRKLFKNRSINLLTTKMIKTLLLLLFLF